MKRGRNITKSNKNNGIYYVSDKVFGTRYYKFYVYYQPTNVLLLKYNAPCSGITEFKRYIDKMLSNFKNWGNILTDDDKCKINYIVSEIKDNIICENGVYCLDWIDTESIKRSLARAGSDPNKILRKLGLAMN